MSHDKPSSGLMNDCTQERSESLVPVVIVGQASLAEGTRKTIGGTTGKHSWAERELITHARSDD